MGDRDRNNAWNYVNAIDTRNGHIICSHIDDIGKNGIEPLTVKIVIDKVEDSDNEEKKNEC